LKDLRAGAKAGLEQDVFDRLAVIRQAWSGNKRRQIFANPHTRQSRYIP
jgi:hypothetical protein